MTGRPLIGIALGHRWLRAHRLDPGDCAPEEIFAGPVGWLRKGKTLEPWQGGGTASETPAPDLVTPEKLAAGTGRRKDDRAALLRPILCGAIERAGAAPAGVVVALPEAWLPAMEAVVAEALGRDVPHRVTSRTRAVLEAHGHEAFPPGAWAVHLGATRLVLADRDRTVTHEVGSELWTRALEAHLAERFIRAHRIDPRDDPRLYPELRRRAEEAKRAICERTSVTVDLAFKEKSTTVHLTAADLASCGKKPLLRLASRLDAFLGDARPRDTLLSGGGILLAPAVRAVEERAAHGSLRREDLAWAPSAVSRGACFLASRWFLSKPVSVERKTPVALAVAPPEPEPTPTNTAGPGPTGQGPFAPGPAPLELRVLSGALAGRVFTVPDRPAGIGRAGDAAIRLDPEADRAVSGRHASIEADGEGLWIEDAGSRGGTWLGGSPVQGRSRLSEGDVLRLGGPEGGVYVEVVRTGASLRPVREVLATARPPYAAGDVHEPRTARLLLVEVGGRGRRFEAPAADAVTVGRTPGSTIRLSDVLDPMVSRDHARFTRGRAGWAIEDLGAMNGTFVNGRRVQRAEVRPGDEVRFGAEGPVFRVEG